MAAPSPWRWRMHNSSPKHSSIIPSSSFNSSVHPYIFTHTQRSPFTCFIFLHNRHPSPPPCCIVRPNNARTKVYNKLQIRETSVTDNEVSSSKYEQSLKKKHNLNYKSVLSKRSLWRKLVSPSMKVRGILLLNVITLLYASNIPVLKEVETVVDPSAFSAVRFTIAAIPFLPFVWRAWGDVRALNSGFELGLWASLGYLMQAFGLLTSDAGRASVITMFTVIVVPLIDGMLGAVVPASTWFGALMSIVGVGMMECSGSPPCVGDLFNFLSALFFGIHMLRTEHISRKTDKANFLPVLGYEVCVVALSSIIWHLIGRVIDGNLEYHPSSWTSEMFVNEIMKFPWIPALYTGVFTTGLCLWIEMTSMRDVSATETAIVYGLEPVWGAGFAWFFLGERWGVSGWFGAALVLGGSLMVQIIGASSPSSSSVKCNTEEIIVSDRQNEVSAVSLVPTKDVKDLIIKK
ncbi:putative EamA domain-containing protein [Helianthus anomalus]